MSYGNRKHSFNIAFIVVIVLGFAVFVAPKLVDVNRYRGDVAARIEEATGKPAQIGHLGLTLFPHLAIQVDDFSLGNPKNFPAGDFVKTHRIYAELNARALLNRQIEIQSLALKNPEIHLLSGTDGHWNFENPPEEQPSATQPPASSSGKSVFQGKISEIRIDNGLITMANLLPGGRMGPVFFEGQGISCRFEDIDLKTLGSPSPSAALLDRSEPLLAGLLWSPATVYAEGPPSGPAHGSFSADSLRLGAIQATSLRAQARIFPKQVFLDDLTFNLDGGSAKGKVSLDFSDKDMAYAIHSAFQNIDAAKLLQAFPNAKGKMTGTMEGNLDLTGKAGHSPDPLSELQGTGQVSVRKGRLPSLSLNRNLLALVQFAGLGPTSGDPASFSLISTDLNLANQRLTSHNVKIVGQGVSVDASGNVALVGSGQMDYTGVARIATKQTGLTNILANISGATFANGQLTFPFDLQGTFGNPKFIFKPAQGAPGRVLIGPASVGKTASDRNRNSPANLLQDLSNLLGKKPAAKTPKP